MLSFISELNVFNNTDIFGKISNNWPNYLFGTNNCKTLESCRKSLLITLQGTNTTLLISKRVTFYCIYLQLSIFSVRPNNFIVSGVKSLR